MTNRAATKHGRLRDSRNEAGFAMLLPTVRVAREAAGAVLAFPMANHAQMLGFEVTESKIFLESTFQDPCPTLNGTRRVTMPQELTRRSGPITLSCEYHQVPETKPLLKCAPGA